MLPVCSPANSALPASSDLGPLSLQAQSWANQPERPVMSLGLGPALGPTPPPWSSWTKATPITGWSNCTSDLPVCWLRSSLSASYASRCQGQPTVRARASPSPRPRPGHQRCDRPLRLGLSGLVTPLQVSAPHGEEAWVGSAPAFTFISLTSGSELRTGAGGGRGMVKLGDPAGWAQLACWGGTQVLCPAQTQAG